MTDPGRHCPFSFWYRFLYLWLSRIPDIVANSWFHRLILCRRASNANSS
jgi:hypothetical protein